MKCPGCGVRLVDTLASLDREEGLVCDECGTRKSAPELVQKLRRLDAFLTRPLDRSS